MFKLRQNRSVAENRSHISGGISTYIYLYMSFTYSILLRAWEQLGSGRTVLPIEVRETYRNTIVYIQFVNCQSKTKVSCRKKGSSELSWLCQQWSCWHLTVLAVQLRVNVSKMIGDILGTNFREDAGEVCWHDRGGCGGHAGCVLWRFNHGHSWQITKTIDWLEVMLAGGGGHGLAGHC